MTSKHEGLQMELNMGAVAYSVQSVDRETMTWRVSRYTVSVKMPSRHYIILY